jgi:hypothetical protein
MYKPYKSRALADIRLEQSFVRYSSFVNWKPVDELWVDPDGLCQTQLVFQTVTNFLQINFQ